MSKTIVYLFDPPNTLKTVESFVDMLSDFCDVYPIDWCQDELVPKNELPLIFWTKFVINQIKHLRKFSILGVGSGAILASRIHYLMPEKIDKMIMVNCGFPYRDGIQDFLHNKPVEYWIKDNVSAKDLSENKISFQNLASYMLHDKCDIRKVLEVLCYKNIPKNFKDYRISKLLTFQIDKDLELSEKGRESVLSYDKSFFIFSEDDYFMKFSKVDEIDWLQMKKRYYIRHDWMRWVKKIKKSRHLIEYDQPEIFSLTVQHIMNNYSSYDEIDAKPRSWKTKHETVNSFTNWESKPEDEALMRYRKLYA